MNEADIIRRYNELLPKLGHSQACVQIARIIGETSTYVAEVVFRHETGRGAG